MTPHTHTDKRAHMRAHKHTTSNNNNKNKNTHCTQQANKPNYQFENNVKISGNKQNNTKDTFLHRITGLITHNEN